MGCDIHLRVEKRRVKTNSLNERNEWRGVGFYGEFSDRIYGMFARMANVRDSWGYKMFEARGLPKDIAWPATEAFYLKVTENEEAAVWSDRHCLKKDAERWVEEGYSEWVDDKHTMVTDPDLHSHSWLTAEELRKCFDDCFKDEDGTYKGDYVDWLGLVSFCEGIESTGEFDCRVVFAFDN